MAYEAAEGQTRREVYDAGNARDPVEIWRSRRQQVAERIGGPRLGMPGPRDLDMAESGIDRLLAHREERPLDEAGRQDQRDDSEYDRGKTERCTALLPQHAAERQSQVERKGLRQPGDPAHPTTSCERFHKPDVKRRDRSAEAPTGAHG